MKEEGYGISLSDLVMTMSGTMTPFVIALSRLGSLTSDFSLLGTHHGRILAEGHCQYWNRAGEKMGLERWTGSRLIAICFQLSASLYATHAVALPAGPLPVAHPRSVGGGAGAVVEISHRGGPAQRR